MLHFDVLLQALLLAKKSLREGTEATDYIQALAKFNNCRFLIDAAIANVNKEIGEQEAAGTMEERELSYREKEDRKKQQIMDRIIQAKGENKCQK